MKEKKSNVKNNVTIEDEQKIALIRLFGLFFIVYSILCFTSSHVGSILSTPFTFLVGSAAPIALLLLMICGGYMLLFKKLFSGFNTIQWILITLIIIFSLVATTATDANQNMTFKSCFKDYLSIYKYNYGFIIDNEVETISQFGGGMIGYMFYGLLNSITGVNSTITLVITIIVLVGVIFIFIIPYVLKFILWCKKQYNKNSEKRTIRKQKRLEKKEKEEKLKQERMKNSDPIKFNIKDNNKDNDDIVNTDIDDLLETTEINISGENYSYVKSGKDNVNKLSSILDVFDDDIYSKEMKKVDSTDDSSNVKFSDDYSVDFDMTNTVVITPIDNVKEDTSNNVFVSDDVVINNENDGNDDNNNNVIISNIDNNDDDNDNESINNTITITPFVSPIVNDNDDNDEDDEKDNTVILNNLNDNSDDENNNVSLNNQDEVKEVVDLYNIDYVLPPLYLLKDSTDNGANEKNDEIARIKADILMEKMRELNVSATINAYVVGPAVTRFEISLAPGVRVGSFTNLQEDFKLALGVNSIRIESPIPGKSAIGIEVPNEYRAMVSMKEIITKMPDKKHKLYVPVGKDITGIPLSFPICDMPHCLISGATNSGKSVCANTIILSLLMNYKPSEVRLIMVDPKRVEMLFYKDIPHLLCPIITEAEKARVALDKLCDEMNKRFTTFSKVGVKNIASYNEVMLSENKNKMPFIILVVDEFAELMLCKNHNIVEEKIQKLAQLGRAAGIHLILSTQRPDVNVIPGTIKTNLPCRMTFRLSSVVDSRTVIDVGGAEKLLNNGDMLLLTPDFTGLRRVQGVYVSDKEIADVVAWCKKQVGPQYDKNFLDLRTPEEILEEEKLKYALAGNNNNENVSTDPLYEDVKRCVIKERKASSSFLQRKFGIGYSKAARYIDMLEEEGIVGPENGSKPREVLVFSEDDLNNE